MNPVSSDIVVVVLALLAVVLIAILLLWRRRGSRLFSEYAEDSRRAIFWAVHICAAMGERSISPAHLLLGVLREDEKLAEQTIGSDNRARLIEQLRALASGKKYSIDGIPLSPSAKRVIGEYARDSARLKNSGRVSNLHLLSGILKVEPFESEALKRLGLDLETIRRGVADL